MKKPITTQYDKAGKKVLEYVAFFPPDYPPDAKYPQGTEPWPVLCFLHGSGEHAKSMPLLNVLTLHGPLRPGSSPRATNCFIVVAPQNPQPPNESNKDVWWSQYAEEVQGIVKEVQNNYGGNNKQTYLTGFSLGGNGVFNIALAQRDFWAALWAVDPTTVPKNPNKEPGGSPYSPVFLSLGEYSRKRRLDEFTQFLGEYLYCDRGKDHVGTATLAYQDDQIYDWLLTKHL